MANRGLFTFLILFLGLGMLFAGGVNLGFDNAVDDYSVTDESITVNYTDPVAVDEQPKGATYAESVDVYNASGTLLTEGEDYNWLQDDGAVEFLDTTATASGETASISYEYDAPPESNIAMSGAVEAVTIALTLILILLIGQWVFDVVGDW